MNDENIRPAIENSVATVTENPSRGQKTAITKIRLNEGLVCEIEEGPWRLTTGMPKAYGGAQEAPTPGVLGRAALGSCLATGYAMWAARLGVPVDSIEVEIQADFDARGELGVSDEIRPGYLEIRYIVSVSSPARPEVVERWLDTADRYSSWRDNIANAVPLVCERRVTTTAR
jgi:uncharacterized OsmC-like protein